MIAHDLCDGQLLEAPLPMHVLNEWETDLELGQQAFKCRQFFNDNGWICSNDPVVVRHSAPPPGRSTSVLSTVPAMRHAAGIVPDAQPSTPACHTAKQPGTHTAHVVV